MSDFEKPKGKPKGAREEILHRTRRKLKNAVQKHKTNVELSDKPTALLALKLSDLKRGYIDVNEINTGIESTIEDQEYRITDYERKGYQLVFVLDGGSWKLFYNKSTASNDVVEEVLTQSDLQNFWEQNHPVESRRKTLNERNNKGYSQ